MKYKYKVCGIVFESDIFYPELAISNEKPEVSIAYGEVPEHLENTDTAFSFIEANESQYLLKLDKIGKYLVEKGSKITIQLYEEGLKEDLERFVLTNILGAISYMRDFIPMHGGVVIKNDKSFLISGLSGKGKSSLLASLLKEGYTLLSDDISNISLQNDVPFVNPGFQYLLLWKDTIDKCELEFGQYNKLLSENEKYFFPIPDNQFQSEKVKLDHIIILYKGNEDEEIAIKGLKKIETLKLNTFKPWMIKSFGKNTSLFSSLIKMGGHVSLHTFDCNHKIPIKQNTKKLIKMMDEICLTEK